MLAPQLRQDQRDGGRGHAFNPRRVGQRAWPRGLELLLQFGGQSGKIGVDKSFGYESFFLTLLGIDADERVERHFRLRAQGGIVRAERDGHAAVFLPYAELWDRPDQYRVDGIWGKKMRIGLFKFLPDHEVDPLPHHGTWAPLNHKSPNGYPTCDARFYHLGMLDDEEREARRARLDPRLELQLHAAVARACGRVWRKELRKRMRSPAGRPRR